MDSLNEEIDSTLDNSLMMEQDGFGQMAQAFGRSATNPIFKEFKQTCKKAYEKINSKDRNNYKHY